MAWIGGHAAIGMITAGSAAAAICAIRRRGWKSVPIAMVAGGLWAVIPDLPHTIRQDFPDSVLASWFGSRAATAWLHEHGDWFFFHKYLDFYQTNSWGLRGLALITLAYNLLVIGLFHAVDSQRKVISHLREHLWGQELLDENAPESIPLPAAADPPALNLVGDHASSRRRHERFKIRQPVVAVSIDPLDQTMRQLRDTAVLDISDGGMAIATSTPVEPGSVVRVRPRGPKGTQDKEVAGAVLERMDFEGRYKLRCRKLGEHLPTQVFKAA